MPEGSRHGPGSDSIVLLEREHDAAGLAAAVDPAMCLDDLRERQDHEADLHDDRYDEPGATGLDIISRGLTLVLDDDCVLEVSAAIFDGLYEHHRRTVLGERLG